MPRQRRPKRPGPSGLARILLRMVVAAFVPAGPIVVGVDHTLERRRGRRIGSAGHFCDADRSSAEWRVTRRGLHDSES